MQQSAQASPAMGIDTDGNRIEARDFVSQIAGLRETAPGAWETAQHAHISYPESGHATFASVEQTSYWFNHRNTVIASVVARFPPSGIIVDVGGGNGYVSLGLQQAGFNSVVVEPGAQGAQCASERGLPVIQASFETLDIPRGIMPAAGLFDVLEHIEDESGALRGLHDGIRPGGMLYLTVPAFGWLWSSEDVKAGHYRRYTLASLAHSVGSAGFDIEYATYFFSMLVPPVLALRTVPTKLGLTRSNMQTDTADDHRLPAGLIGIGISKAMAWEAGRIARGKTVAFGSSCLLVARRTNARA